MTLKEYLHIRQNMLHNPAYLMGFGQQVRNQILEKMAKFAQSHGLDVPGFSGLSATDVRKSARAEIVSKAHSKKELETGQRWITIHPGGTATRIEIGEDGNEKEVKNYRRVLIDEDGKIVGGGVPREWQGHHVTKISQVAKQNKPSYSIHLQGIGEVPAIKAKDIKPGTRLVWNYGGVTEVESVKESPSGKTIQIVERNVKTGEKFTRRLNKERLVGLPPTSPGATKRKEDGHKTSNQNTLDAKSPDDEYDNRTPGPFTQNDVDRFNRTTNYPITLDGLNRDHAKQTKEDRDKVLAQLKRWGIEEIPDDVQQALKKLTDARVHYTREMIRAREIAPPWTVTGRSKYQGKPEKARGVEERAKQQLEDAKEHLEKVLKRHDPNRPISSDDPDAIERLQKKIDKLEKEQESYKKINTIVRKKGLSVDEKIKRLTEEVGIGIETAKKLLEPAWNGDVGIPSFALENNRAEIKRLKERLEKLQNAQHESTSEIEFNGGNIVDNVKDNRVQIFFDSKPSEDLRVELKKHGFKWAPSVGAWQRMRSNTAIYWARKITGAEDAEKSMRTKEAWRDVKQRKEAEYGDDEYFADPAHASYPLTENGKPSRKRTLAAWRYINARRNAGKYAPEQLKRVKGRIKRFAKEHFGLELQDGGDDVKKSMWDYPVVDDSQGIRDYVFSGVWKSEEDRKQWEEDIHGIRAMLEALRTLDDARRHEEEEMQEESGRLVLRRRGIV